MLKLLRQYKYMYFAVPLTLHSVQFSLLIPCSSYIMTE